MMQMSELTKDERNQGKIMMQCQNLSKMKEIEKEESRLCACGSMRSPAGCSGAIHATCHLSPPFCGNTLAARSMSVCSTKASIVVTAGIDVHALSIDVDHATP